MRKWVWAFLVLTLTVGLVGGIWGNTEAAPSEVVPEAIVLLVTKELITSEPLVPGTQAVFEVRITSGNGTFIEVSLEDTYDASRLQFVSASPVAPDSTAPGVLTWNDLTTTMGDISAGDTLTLVLTFQVLANPGPACNTASVDALSSVGTSVSTSAQACGSIATPTPTWTPTSTPTPTFTPTWTPTPTPTWTPTPTPTWTPTPRSTPTPTPTWTPTSTPTWTPTWTPTPRLTSTPTPTWTPTPTPTWTPTWTPTPRLTPTPTPTWTPTFTPTWTPTWTPTPRLTPTPTPTWTPTFTPTRVPPTPTPTPTDAGGAGETPTPFVTPTPTPQTTPQPTGTPCFTSLGGTVFLDQNMNGTYQYPVEPGIPGVTVLISGPVNTTATTNANGWWQVGGLPLGNYTITVVPPAGYTVIGNTVHNITLTHPCQQILSLHFALVPGSTVTPTPTPTWTPTPTPTRPVVTGRICGDVFLDVNEDNLFNAGDLPLPAVLVRLLDGGNNLIQATNSDGAGRYCFYNLPPGSYKVEVDEVDLDLPLGAVLVTPPNPWPVVLPTGGAVEHDFGFRVPGGTTTTQVDVDKRVVSPPDGTAEIGDTVIFEIEVRNTGNTALTKVPLVDVYDAACYRYLPKTASPPEQSSEPGRIEWLNLVLSFGRYLEPGESFIVRVPLQVIADGEDCQNRAIVDGAESFGQPVPGDEDTAGVVVITATGVIGDRVWLDCNGNRVLDPGEPGLANVRLFLYRDNGDGMFDPATDALVGQTFSDADGTYAFAGLSGGTYWVWVDETTTLGLVATTNNPVQVVLPEGITYLGADFGYAQPITLSGVAWLDTDGDGQRDATETLGIGGVPVTATNTFGQTWVEFTDYEGRFTFTNLPPGTYTVEVAPVDGMGNSTPRVYQVGPLTCGDVVDDLDVGYTLPTSVEVLQVETVPAATYIELRWYTRGESARYGFYIYRATQRNGEYVLLTPYPVYPGNLDGTYAIFTYRDTNVTPGQVYYYQIVSLFDGTRIGPIAAQAINRTALTQRVYITFIQR